MNDQAAGILKQYWGDFSPSSLHPLGSAGGFSGARFWRIRTEEAEENDLAFRRWPQEYPTPERLQTIHNVLNRAARRGIVCLPVPIETNTGASFVQLDGHLWELAPWLNGEADYWRNPSPAKLSAALTTLAQFHLAAKDGELKTIAPAIVERFELLMQLNQRTLESMARSLDAAVWPALVEPARQFLALVPGVLMRVIPPLAKLTDIRVPVQPCIRDIWHDHVLFTGDCVTGMVDFGAMREDSPAVDIARLLGSLVGDVAFKDAACWQTGLDAYQAVRPLSTDELSCVSALDSAGTVLAGCNWIRWVFAENRRFEHAMEVESRFAGLLRRLRYLENSGPIVAK